MDVVGQLAGFDLFEHRGEDKFSKLVDGDRVGIGDIVEDDHVAGGDVPEYAVVVGKGKGVLRLAVDDQDPLACRGTAEGTLGKKQRTEVEGKEGFEHFWIGHGVLFDDQFDWQGGWVAVDIASQVEDPSLGFDDRSGGDEDFSGRLSGGDQ